MATYDEIKAFLNDEVFPDCLTGRKQSGEKANFKKRAAKFCIVHQELHYGLWSYRFILKNTVLYFFFLVDDEVSVIDRYEKNKKVAGGPSTLEVVKTRADQETYLKAVHKVLGSTTESKSLGGHLGRDKTLWMLID